MSIAWPDPSPAPPPPPPPVHVPVPEAEVRRTRKKMMMWDRTKILIVIALLFAFLTWNDMADNPIIPFREALRETARAKWWFFLAFVLELVRQIHYVICEHSTRYNMFWEDQVFGRFNKRADEDEPVDALPHRAGVSSGCSSASCSACSSPAGGMSRRSRRSSRRRRGSTTSCSRPPRACRSSSR